MTAAHVKSDQTAIVAAADNRTAEANRAFDEAAAWLKRTPSWASLECVQQRALAVLLDRVRVLEAGNRIPVTINPAPITPAPNGERKPLPMVPRYPDTADYR